jgi:hypothetical protein
LYESAIFAYERHREFSCLATAHEFLLLASISTVSTAPA